MYPEILHIYGPIGIKSYGLCIAIGLALFIYHTYKFLVYSHILSEHHYFSLLLYGILSAILGGRLLYLSYHADQITHFADIFALWYGGFSILGSIIAVSITTTLYTIKHKIPFALITDRFALFGPLLQSISRLGCFFSGCCWGIKSNSFIAITYTHQNISAPLHIPLHPTQLYSAVILFGIFNLFYSLRHNILKHKTLMLTLYFFCVSLERFVVDFWRGEREFFNYVSINLFSINQWIALCILVSSLVYVIILMKKNYEFIHSHQKPGLHT